MGTEQYKEFKNLTEIANTAREEVEALNELHPTKDTSVPVSMSIDVLIKELKKLKKQYEVSTVKMEGQALVANNGIKIISSKTGDSNPAASTFE